MAMKKENMDDPQQEISTPTPPPPDPWSVLDRLTRAMENLSARPDTGGGNIAQLMETLSGALARVSETQLEGSKLIADETRRAARPSNQVVPAISVFNRRGLTLPDNAVGPRKVPLKCIMMIPWLAEWESLTREEVDLLNLLEPGTYSVSRIDKSKVKVSVAIEYKIDDVTPSRLLMTHDTAFNNDYFKLMPDLAGWIRQMLKQHDYTVAKKASEVMTDEEEEALIEAEQLTVSV